MDLGSNATVVSSYCVNSDVLWPRGYVFFFFFSSRRRHTRSTREWSSDVCSSDLGAGLEIAIVMQIFFDLRPGPSGQVGEINVGRGPADAPVHRIGLPFRNQGNLTMFEDRKSVV